MSSIRAEEIVLAFNLSDQAAGVLSLLKEYADRDMDLADACTSAWPRSRAIVGSSRSIAADFSAYRRNGRELVPVIAPPSGS